MSLIIVNFKKKFPEKDKWPHAKMKNLAYSELGKWVGHQRALYKKNKLEKEKINLLKKINFDFQPMDDPSEKWTMMYRDVIEYKKTHNKKEPPRIQPIKKGIEWGYSEHDLILGDWCYKQRRSKRLGRLKKEKIDLLTKINFDWKENKVLNYNNETWERNFYLLKKFWQKNSGRNPQPYNPKEKSLHNFWKGQKRAFERGSLTQYRIKKLKQIGFSFQVRRYGKHSGRSEWDKIISKGENERIEFKSSLRWDYKTNTKNDELEYPVVKTVDAFLNSKGGYLFIGVDNHGKILGIEKDYSTLGGKQNQDGFLLHLNNLINNHLGKDVHQYISTKIEKINDKEVCIMTISHSDNPIYLKNKNKEEFFIRGVASTESLSLSQAVGYIRNHWKIK